MYAITLCLHILCLQETQAGGIHFEYTKVYLCTPSLLCLQEIQTGGTWYAIWVHKSLHTLSLLYLQETQVQI